MKTAAQQGHTDCLDSLVKEGASVEHKSEAFCAALCDLSENFKCAECAEILWDKGIDVHFRYFNGETPLICAASSDQYSLVQKLIAAGASVNAVNNDGSGALHCSRSKECTELLIREGADVNLKNHYGDTPLHYAVHESIDSSLSLIMAGADVNAKSNYGETPLINAASVGNVHQIELLLEKGSTVRAFDSFGKNALYYAACEGNNNIIQLLLRGGADVNEVNQNVMEYSLIAAATKGHEECIQTLLQAGADVNVTDLSNNTALLNVAERGYGGCMKLILEAGADVNICSDSGTALHYATRLGYSSCIHWLVQAGADVNYLNWNSRSPLMLAACNKLLDSVKLLLQAGAEVRLTDRVGCNALHYSVIKHARGFKSEAVIEIVGLLLAAGERRKEGVSDRPLHMPRKDQLRKSEVVTEMVRLPYGAGDSVDHWAIQLQRMKSYRKRLITILDDSPIEPNMDLDQLSDIVRQYLSEDAPTLCLKDICRRTIREHLLQMSRVNLFVRVPHLGLPSLLAEFLLYDVSLELQ